MTTITAHPKSDKNHLVTEHFNSEVVAEQWKRMLADNGWEIVE